MSVRQPTEDLEREHRFIEKVVKACFVTVEEIGGGGPVDSDLLRQIVDFMRVYADKCHHGKEEALLFPALHEKGVPITGCPIGALSAEHVQGRRLVTGLADALELFRHDEPKAGGLILENLKGVTQLYPNHIWKEDYLLFPMTLKVMSNDDLSGLGEKFENVDQSIGVETLREYEKFAGGLEARWKAKAETA
jgi:hemerythrin-like domain-containing protein